MGKKRSLLFQAVIYSGILRLNIHYDDSNNSFEKRPTKRLLITLSRFKFRGNDAE